MAGIKSEQYNIVTCVDEGLEGGDSLGHHVRRNNGSFQLRFKANNLSLGKYMLQQNKILKLYIIKYYYSIKHIFKHNFSLKTLSNYYILFPAINIIIIIIITLI